MTDQLKLPLTTPVIRDNEGRCWFLSDREIGQANITSGNNSFGCCNACDEECKEELWLFEDDPIEFESYP